VQRKICAKESEVSSFLVVEETDQVEKLEHRQTAQNQRCENKIPEPEI
jgi:hypothetical protein